MPESETDEDGGNWLTNLVEGGLPQLAIGKHASRAIGRLIAGLADVPVAGLENLSSRIRDDTKARSQVKAALAKAAAAYVKTQPEIIERSTNRWTGETIRKQENVEAVAIKTLEHLRDEPGKEAPSHGPSDDFMNRFSGFAGDASSDELRDLFARVLAGEIREPGSISLATLQFVSVMDQPLAKLIERARSWVPSDWHVPQTNELNEGEKFEVFSRLTYHGLVRPGFTNRTVTFSSMPVHVLFYGTAVLTIYGEPNGTFNYGVIPITQVGQQVMSLLPQHADMTVVLDAAKFLRDRAGINKVSVTELGPLDDSGAYAPLSERIF